MTVMRIGDVFQRLRGFSPFGGVSWTPPPSEREAARRLMIYLYDRRVLHALCSAEVPEHVVRSVLEIRKELTDIAKQFSPGDEIELKLRAMRAACVDFINRVQSREEIIVSGSTPGHWASWEFIDALGQWRAFMAVYVGMIASMYEIEPPPFLLSLLPAISEPEEAENRPSSSDRGLGDLIEEFAMLSRQEKERQLGRLNRYLERRGTRGVRLAPRIGGARGEDLQPTRSME